MKVVLWTLGELLLGGALAFGIGLLWLTKAPRLSARGRRRWA